MASPYALDFSPIIEAIRNSQQLDLQRNQLGMQQERLGFERDLHPLAVQAQRQNIAHQAEAFPLDIQQKKQSVEQGGLELDKNKAASMAGFVQTHVLDPTVTPEERAQRWSTLQQHKIFAGDGKFFNDPVYGRLWKDPATGPQMLMGMVRGYQAPQQFDLAPDHTRFQSITKPDGTVTIAPVAVGGTAQDATTKKAIDEADDFVLQTKTALGSLKEARQLNRVAYDGALAAGRATTVNNVYATENSKATTLLENLISNQALQSLRSTFGGNPTEGERKILLEVAGSVNQPRAVREEIYKRAQAAAETRLQFNAQKADSLRKGSYYKPGGQPPVESVAQRPAPPSPQQGQLPRITGDADYAALPSGAQYIDPQGQTRTKR